MHRPCGRLPRRSGTHFADSSFEHHRGRGESSNEASRFPEIRIRRGRGRRGPGAGDLVARQGAGAPGDLADRLRERAEQHRHPRRRHQRAGLRGVVELLRPPDQPRDEDGQRHALLRPRQVQDGARRGHERRRHVGDVQAEEERDLPRRHAGHRQGREVVARSRRHGRRLPDLPDGRGLAHQARAVRRGRRSHGARRLPARRTA